MTTETQCPSCGKEIKTLSMLTTSDGRVWFNLACAPCSMARNEFDQWTFYAGGTTDKHATTR